MLGHNISEANIILSSSDCQKKQYAGPQVPWTFEFLIPMPPCEPVKYMTPLFFHPMPSPAPTTSLSEKGSCSRPTQVSKVERHGSVMKMVKLKNSFTPGLADLASSTTPSSDRGIVTAIVTTIAQHTRRRCQSAVSTLRAQQCLRRTPGYKHLWSIIRLTAPWLRGL